MNHLVSEDNGVFASRDWRYNMMLYLAERIKELEVVEQAASSAEVKEENEEQSSNKILGYMREVGIPSEVQDSILSAVKAIEDKFGPLEDIGTSLQSELTGWIKNIIKESIRDMIPELVLGMEAITETGKGDVSLGEEISRIEASLMNT